MNQTYKEFLSVLGYLYLQNGREDKAFTVFSALCEFFPDDVRLGLCLGYVQLLNGDFVPAVKRADQFLDSGIDADEKVMGQMIRSRALWGMGRKKEARVITGRLLQTGKENK